MKERERLQAQNRILRELLETFIDATNPDHIELSIPKILHIRMKSISLLKRIDDFDTKRFSKTGNN